jgi:hypothetical protein
MWEVYLLKYDFAPHPDSRLGISYEAENETRALSRVNSLVELHGLSRDRILRLEDKELYILDAREYYDGGR